MKMKKLLLDFISDYLDKIKPNEFLFIGGDTYEIKNIQDLYSIEVNWTFGDCSNRLKEIKENFLLIINFQPIIGLNSVIEASKLLNSKGFGFFVTTPKFFIENESFVKTLQENALNVRAAIFLQKGCYTSSNQNSKLLIIIRRGNSEELFVGELMDDVEPREQLLKNLKNFTEDKTPQLGTIINVDGFRKFSHLMFSKKLSNELKSVNRVKLSDISLEIIVNDDEIEGLLAYKYQQKHTFAILSLLYSNMDYTKRVHKDHIFPQAFFKKRKLRTQGFSENDIKFYMDNYDFVGNLQLLPGIKNEIKGSKDFKDWIDEEFPNDHEEKEYLKNNYIPYEISLEFKNFKQFYEKREQLLLQKFKNILII